MPAIPVTGVLLLDLESGALRAASPLGSDPIAAAVAPDGRTAFVSDNAGGRVTALSLPGLAVRWSADVGGRPGPLLPVGDTVVVSLYAADAVVALRQSDGRELRRTAVCHAPGQLAMVRDEVVASCATARGFGLAVTPAGTWSAEYDSGRLSRSDGLTVSVPPGLHPFWLTAADDGGIYVAAEGGDEDADPGAILAVDPRGSMTVLARERDPDQIEVASGRLLVAAHGEREVTVIDRDGRRPARGWAKGTGAVALAADAPLRLLVVVANARE